MSQNVSKLINDLTKIPNIIGGLGLSIAAAQKAFNLDYLNNIERILAMTETLLSEQVAGPAGAPVEMTPDQKTKLEGFKTFFMEMLKQLAPARYQFTETTLAVKLDLAQSFDASGTIGLGIGYGGVAVNIAASAGYARDYRAAAECRTIINAIPADSTAFTTLLNNATAFRGQALDLPPQAQVDDAIIEQTRTTFSKLMGAEPPEIESQSPPAG